MDDSGAGVECTDTKQYRFYSLPGLPSNPVAGRTLASMLKKLEKQFDFEVPYGIL